MNLPHVELEDLFKAVNNTVDHSGTRLTCILKCRAPAADPPVVLREEEVFGEHSGVLTLR